MGPPSIVSFSECDRLVEIVFVQPFGGLHYGKKSDNKTREAYSPTSKREYQTFTTTSSLNTWLCSSKHSQKSCCDGVFFRVAWYRIKTSYCHE